MQSSANYSLNQSILQQILMANCRYTTLLEKIIFALTRYFLNVNENTYSKRYQTFTTRPVTDNKCSTSRF